MILLVVPAVAVAIASLGAFFGEWVWWLDVLANFRFQYLIVLTVAGVAILFSRWRYIGYGILVAAAINLVVIAPLYVSSPGRSDPSLPGLRILNFNLLSSNQQYGEVIEYIKTVDADLVFLYEASRPWEAALSEAGWDYEFVRARSDNLIFGTVVLARDEVEVVSYGFAESEPRAISLTYHPDDWPVPVQVLSVHPASPTNAERAAVRDAQLAFAANWADEQKGAYVVVGDLNATPWSAPFRRLVREGDLRNSQLGFGLQVTFPADGFWLFRVPIDHLLHSGVISVRDRFTGPGLGSDHFPLVVDLQYNG